jgi:hypothetical protein
MATAALLHGGLGDLWRRARRGGLVHYIYDYLILAKRDKG